MLMDGRCFNSTRTLKHGSWLCWRSGLGAKDALQQTRDGTVVALDECAWNVWFNLRMEFGKPRPVNAGLEVVRCVVAQVESRQVVHLRSDVARALHGLLGVQPRVMVVGGLECEERHYLG